MNCPFCNSKNTRIYATNAKWNKKNNGYKRYQKCKDCGGHFITHEHYAKEYNNPKAYIK